MEKKFFKKRKKKTLFTERKEGRNRKIPTKVASKSKIREGQKGVRKVAARKGNRI